MKLLFATIATITVALAGSPMAHAATLAADPALSCYPEGSPVFLPGEGFSPNAPVNFTRDGMALPVDPPIVADAAGQISATLTLPGLLKGQRTLDYVATDSANTANTAALSLLVTATDVSLKPKRGKPQRLLTIGARILRRRQDAVGPREARPRTSAQRQDRAHRGALQEGQGKEAALPGRRRLRQVPGPVRRLQALQEAACLQVDLQRDDLPHLPPGHRGECLKRAVLELDPLAGPAGRERERPASGPPADRQRDPLSRPAATPLDAVAAP